MNAGRELDALIAEKITQLWWVNTEDHSGKTFVQKTSLGYLWKDEKNTYYSFILPNYSTDIAAAWAVVDTIKTIDNGVVRPPARFTLQRIDSTRWRAGYMEFIDWTLDIEAPTAPHAICLAALEVIDNKR